VGALNSVSECKLHYVKCFVAEDADSTSSSESDPLIPERLRRVESLDIEHTEYYVYSGQ